MIKFTWAKLPVDESGKAYDSLAAFQAAEINKLMNKSCSKDLAEDVTMAIVMNKAEIIEILELTESARPTARGPRKKKLKTVAQGELPRVA